MRNMMWLVIALGIMMLALQPALYAQEKTEEPAIEAEEEEALDIATGKVATVDLTGNKLAITDTEGATQEFSLDPELTVVWDDSADEEKELTDLAMGKDVVVEFRLDEAGKKIATWIDLVVAETKEEAPATEAPVPAPAVE